MLLPSALPCDVLVASTRFSQRPKLPSFDTFPSQPQLSHASSSSIMASCRALQNVLGAYMPSTSSQVQSENTSQPMRSSPFSPRKLQPSPQIVFPPRGANKRSRDEFEEDDIPQVKDELPAQTTRDLFQTPKRQRRIPDEIPRGLRSSDFQSLYTPPQQLIQQQETEIEMPPLSYGLTSQTPSSVRLTSPTRQLSEDVPQGWSPTDDRRLVQVVLSKLNLSAREWNACAEQLGKDKDSLGRRWKHLVGEGNVGLRRGSGKLHGRTDLDIASW